VVYRDFRYHNPVDFQPGVVGSTSPSRHGQRGSRCTQASLSTRVSAAPPCAERRLVQPVVQRRVRVNHATPTTMTFGTMARAPTSTGMEPTAKQWLTPKRPTIAASGSGTDGRDDRPPIPAHPSTRRNRRRSKKVAAENNAHLLHQQRLLQCHFHRVQVDGNPLFFRLTTTLSPCLRAGGAQIPPYYDPMGPGRLTWMPPETSACTISVSPAKSAIGSSMTRARPTPGLRRRRRRVGLHQPKTRCRSRRYSHSRRWQYCHRRERNGTTTITATMPVTLRLRRLKGPLPSDCRAARSTNSGLPGGAPDHRLVVQADLSGFNARRVAADICGDGVLSLGTVRRRNQRRRIWQVPARFACVDRTAAMAWSMPEPCDDGKNVSAYGTSTAAVRRVA